MTAKKSSNPARQVHSETGPQLNPAKTPGGGPATEVRPRIPAEVPTTYADQIVDVVYGVHTSKIILGVENGSGGVRPVSVVVIPTSTLLIFASTALSDLSSARIIEETQDRQFGMIALMRRLASNMGEQHPAATASKKKRAA